MKLLLAANIFAQKYSRLLVLGVALLLTSPFLTNGKFELLALSSLVLLASALAIGGRNINRSTFALYGCLALLAFGLDGFARLESNVPGLALTAAIADLVYAIALAIEALAIVQQIFADIRVTGDTIRGGVCVFLLAGFAWSLIFDAARELDPAAIALPDPAYGAYDMVYFSFTTLTTLGYGDVIPVSRFVRALANLEAILGLLYPAVFIARLVSLYVIRELDETN
ncbi:potassium channel family protein [Rubidibacter lacunae]|nr:potassium channel family protein [Rubidibacter lacunae]